MVRELRPHMRVMAGKAGSSTPRLLAYAPLTSLENVDARDKPGHDENDADRVRKPSPYAVAISGKTASILVFSVAALNGLTI